MTRVQTQFPKEVQAGLSLKVTIDAPTFLAPEWSLTAHLRGQSAIDITAQGLGTAFTFSVPASVTANYAPGLYAFSIRASDGTDVFEVESGQLEILTDVASLGAEHDARGHAEKVLASIEAVIEGRANKDQQQYTINGRTLVRTPIADLIELRKTYQREVARKKNKGRPRRLLGRTVKVKL